MAWTRTYAASAEGWAPEERLGWVRGSHDGYARAAHGVTHRRTAWLRPDGYVVIRDELTGSGEHAAEAVFQFAPGKLAVDGDAAIFDDRFELGWVCSAPARARVSRGEEGPDSGWVAMSLGVRQAAPRLVIEFPVREKRVVLLTVVADRRRGDRPGSRRVTSKEQAGAGPLAVFVAGCGFVDEVVAAVEGAAATPDVETDAPLLIVRRENASITEALQAGGTRARVNDVAEVAGSPPRLESAVAR
jgi:hypothetical protein